jgi:hypothetical protein
MAIFSIFIFYIACYLLVTLSYLPSLLGVFNGFFPLFETALVFFFLTHKNKDISYFFLLLIFITLDTIQNNIIGTNAIIFFLTMIVFKACKQLFVFEKFNELWIGYFCFCLLTFGLSYVMNYFLTENIIVNSNILIKFLLTIAFYPFFDLLILKLYNKTIMKYHNEKYLI